MRHALVVHNTDLRNSAYLSKLRHAKPYLAKDDSGFLITVVKLGRRADKTKFDVLFYDIDTVKVSDLWEYVRKNEMQISMHPISLTGKVPLRLNVPCAVNKLTTGSDNDV